MWMNSAMKAQPSCMGEENVLYEETWITDYTLLVNDHMKPVPIDEFGAHVQRMHADRRFEMEYNVSLKIITK